MCSEVYTLPTSLEGRRSQGSRPSGHKKREELSFFSSVPPQGVAYTRTEGRKTNNQWTWFAIGFDILSKSCLILQTYLKEPYLQ